MTTFTSVPPRDHLIPSIYQSDTENPWIWNSRKGFKTDIRYLKAVMEGSILHLLTALELAQEIQNQKDRLVRQLQYRSLFDQLPGEIDETSIVEKIAQKIEAIQRMQQILRPTAYTTLFAEVPPNWNPQVTLKAIEEKIEEFRAKTLIATCDGLDSSSLPL